MRTVFTISYKNDPELLVLYHQLGARSFSNFIKDALRRVVRSNYVGTVHVPETLFLENSNTNEKISVNLCITSSKDNDIGTLLQSVKPAMIPKFVKLCARLYLGTKSLEAYFNEDFSNKLASVTCAHVLPIVYQIGENTVCEPTQKRTRVSSRPKMATKNISQSFQRKELQQAPSKTELLQETTKVSIPVSIPNTASSSVPEPVISTATAKIPDYNDNLPVSTENSETSEDDVLSLLESLLS